MSHFVCVVLLEGSKADDDDLSDFVNTALDPFDENKTMPRRKTECYCVGHKAKMEAREATNKKYDEPFLEACREKMAEKFPGERPIFGFNSDEEEVYWNALLQPMKDMEKAQFAAHPLKDKADPECDECKGRGWHFTTYNPKSQWDWYQMGGRWNGYFLPPEEADAADKGQYGLGVESVEGNAIPVRDLLAKWDERFVAFALLTPEGDWLERGSMGWWGCVSDAMTRDEWKQRFKETLEKYPEALAVAVDCHI